MLKMTKTMKESVNSGIQDTVSSKKIVNFYILKLFAVKLFVWKSPAIRDIPRTVTTLMHTRDASFPIVLTDTTREVPP